MDIINIICLCLLMLPFLFGVYLIVSRLSLSSVNRYVLNYGNAAINSILLLFYFAASIFILKDNINFEYNFADFNFNGFEFNFGFLMSPESMSLLLCTAICFLIISIYSNFYFKKKKQFIFTKQRFYAFLAILAFNTYLFLLSKNIFQMLIFWALQGAIVFIFSYFDIFKNSVNFNITRFNRISLIGDFAFMTGVLILYKYSAILELDSSGLNLLEIENTFKEVFINGDIFEIKICLLAFIIAIMTRLYVFPFNCYFSFFANSSDIFYLCVSNFASSVFGIYLLFITLPLIKLHEYELFFAVFFVISGIISLVLIIFEKNVKIIFGYLTSALSAFFLAGSLLLYEYVWAVIYFILVLAITVFFMKLAYIGKINIKPKLFTKKKGFIIERAHIFLFETLPLKVSLVVEIIDRFFVRNIILFFINILDFFIRLFVIKNKNPDRFDYLRAVFIMFALILILAIFIAFFGSGRYNSELIT